MMYCNKLVACIKVDGKILREDKDTVAVPFGSEYSIYIKNLAYVRAMVRLNIDGDNKSDGWFIVPALGNIEIERSIVNGNLDKGHRFKFIERTSQIENHRGIRAEDGIVMIEYKFEKVYTPPKVDFGYYSWPQQFQYNNAPNFGGLVRTTSSGIAGSSSRTMSFSYNSMQSNTAGITAEGAVSDQKFTYGSWFTTEDSTNVIVLKLVGAINEVQVVEPITVKTKSKCPNCGMLNPFGNRFCPACGTGLQKI